MKTIVYVYGVFDLFHLGHYNLLKRAKELGNYLVVGVVDDPAVTKMKGKDRPVENITRRVEKVADCFYVDETILQREFNPMDNIDCLCNNGCRVNLVVLGADQQHLSEKEIRELVESNIMVERLPRTEGVSTTDLIKKMKKC